MLLGEEGGKGYVGLVRALCVWKEVVEVCAWGARGLVSSVRGVRMLVCGYQSDVHV